MKAASASSWLGLREASVEPIVRFSPLKNDSTVRAQRGGIELRGDGRPALIIDGRGHHLAHRTVKPFAQPDVIHVNMAVAAAPPIIMGGAATQPYRGEVLAADPVASPARTVPHAASRIGFESMPKD